LEVNDQGYSCCSTLNQRLQCASSYGYHLQFLIAKIIAS
jgi:hypothetical protein